MNIEELNYKNITRSEINYYNNLCQTLYASDLETNAVLFVDKIENNDLDKIYKCTDADDKVFLLRLSDIDSTAFDKTNHIIILFGSLIVIVIIIFLLIFRRKANLNKLRWNTTDKKIDLDSTVKMI